MDDFRQLDGKTISEDGDGFAADWVNPIYQLWQKDVYSLSSSRTNDGGERKHRSSPGKAAWVVLSARGRREGIHYLRCYLVPAPKAKEMASH